MRKVVVGYSDTDSGNLNAFVWRGGDSKMTGVAPLNADNSGYSYSNGVAADGGEVGGYHDPDSGHMNAFLWCETPGMTASVTLNDAKNGE